VTAYYNENDPKAAAWLRELIARGHIAPGVVDERSIEDVTADDLAGFVQCHFFAGIGVWSYALRLAGWPDDRHIWTGSCPCQPFSAAGKGKGTADERHLWPAWFWLVDQCRPDTIFGEQVSSKDGLGWLDLVLFDLEGAGYAIGALDSCAAGVGAPHIRQRLYFGAERLADADHRVGADGAGGDERDGQNTGRSQGSGDVAGRGESGRVADSGCERRQQVGGSAPGNEAADGRARRIGSEQDRDNVAASDGEDGRLADTTSTRRIGKVKHTEGDPRDEARMFVPCAVGEIGRPGPTNGFWRDADWLRCRDDRWRPVESGTFPLAHGTPARVVKLRGYGNGLVAAHAAAFIEAFDAVTATQPAE
jgi:DNA (cytosine-5)-methyltransferase 1